MHLHTMLTLQELLLEHNTFVPLMKQTYETLYEQQRLGNDDLDLIMHLHFQLGKETQCYNLLETNEILWRWRCSKCTSQHCHSFTWRSTTTHQ